MICCSISAETSSDMLRQMLLVRSKADLIEIRLDYIKNLEEMFIKELIQKKPLPLILTCRKKEEGGNFFGSEEKRMEILKRCIEYGADYIDLEYSCGEKIIKEILQNKKKTKIIVSYHNFVETPKNVAILAKKICLTDCDIVKIACFANAIEDNLIIFNLLEKMRDNKRQKIIALCMGEKGEISRILNIRYGSYLTFGSLFKKRETAPGQICCDILRWVYRADKIKKDWKVYGLIGNPISESRGFLIHNVTFKEKKIDAVYVNFLVTDLDKFFLKFEGFFSGLSITMPYKEKVIKYLDETDDYAKKIGAVNTVLLKNEKMVGYNTDFSGAIEAIEEKIKINGKKIVMIGAGGVAKAIGYGIINKGGNLIIVNRTERKGKSLSKELHCEYKEKSEIDWNSIDLLINATSVGMTPRTEELPIEEKYLKNNKMVVFDTIYNPLITKFLDIARKNKCITISGIKMFTNQAEKQFELFTGKKAEKEFIEKTILECMT